MKKFILKITGGVILTALLLFNAQFSNQNNGSDLNLGDFVNKASADAEFYCDSSGECTGMSMIYVPCVNIIWESYAECVITYDEYNICSAFDQSDC